MTFTKKNLENTKILAQKTRLKVLKCEYFHKKKLDKSHLLPKFNTKLINEK